MVSIGKRGSRSHDWYARRWVPMSQCIIGNDHIGPPPEQKDRNIPVKHNRPATSLGGSAVWENKTECHGFI